MSDTDPRTIDVRPIPKPQRHPLIFDVIEVLAVGESVVILNDHNPIPLRGQVETLYGRQFAWCYLEEGPEIFRLQFTRREPAPAGWQRPESKKNLLNGIALETGAPTPLASATGSAMPAPVIVDLLSACNAASHSGPQWAHECEDLDMTLLSWPNGKSIEAHANNEVDVVMIGVAGKGIVTIDGVAHELNSGVALLVPKGCTRGLQSVSERFSYLSVHRRRRGLMPTLDGKPIS
ncbi:MAG TPA: DUF2249 domain-containing protein [Abditibacteriaceae bacterium]|jgi:uncharacterized protein (DUF2249 family)/quercetin dioxygenase-like cupin family protein